jgi:glycerol-3-phosphate acyltransferase PlsY
VLATLIFSGLGYLIGSISLPQIVARTLYNTDLRKTGTGTAGASNLSTVAPPPVIAAVGVGQMLQGALPALLAKRAGQPEPVQVAAAIASVVGQDWNAGLGFKGGRGVTHSIGALAAIAPETLPTVATAGVAGVATNQVPLGMLAGLALAPIVVAASGRSRTVVRATETLLMLAVSKRLEANGTPVPAGQSRIGVYLQRLLHDRDLADRDRWLGG